MLAQMCGSSALGERVNYGRKLGPTRQLAAYSFDSNYHLSYIGDLFHLVLQMQTVR